MNEITPLLPPAPVTLDGITVERIRCPGQLPGAPASAEVVVLDRRALARIEGHLAERRTTIRTILEGLLDAQTLLDSSGPGDLKWVCGGELWEMSKAAALAWLQANP